MRSGSPLSFLALPRREPVLAGACAALAVCGAELLARQLTRRSLVAWAGWSNELPVAAVLALAAAAAVVGLVASRRAQRREDGSRPLDAAPLVRLVLVTSFVFGLAAQQYAGARLQSDGFFYFAYLRSLAFDHDLDLTNDYELIGVGADRGMDTPTETGYAHTAWSIGPAVLWSPFFAGGHAIARGLAASGLPVGVDGTSFPYRQAVCVGTLVYTLIGLWYSFRLASRFSESVVAAWAAAIMGLGSFIVWYAVREPTMSHALSMAAVAAFIWGWVSTETTRSLLRWAGLGALAGLMVAVRWQNVVFLILPAIDVVAAAVRGTRASRLALAGGVVLATAAGTLTFLPQALAWQAIYGAPLAISPHSPQMHWTSPQWVLTLWSSRNGLFATAPVTYVAAAGLLAFAWRDRAFGRRAVLLVFVAVYVNSVVADWWGGAAYGARRFDGVIPLFVVGMAVAIEQGRSWLARRPLGGVVAALSLLVLWNLTAMAAAVHGVYELGNPRSYGRVAADQASTLHGWIGHPFSYPVNLWYAIRNRVSPARWDLLAFAFLSDPAQPYGRVDIGQDDEVHLGGGWHAPERAPDGRTARWTMPSAELLIALDHAAPLVVQIGLAPFVYREAPPSRVRVTVNGHAFGPFTLGRDWQRLEFSTDTSHWRRGVNRLVLDTLTPASPARVGFSSDTRELGVAVDWVRVQVPN